MESRSSNVQLKKCCSSNWMWYCTQVVQQTVSTCVLLCLFVCLFVCLFFVCLFVCLFDLWVQSEPLTWSRSCFRCVRDRWEEHRVNVHEDEVRVLQFRHEWHHSTLLINLLYPTERQTDRQTDRQTERQTDRIHFTHCACLYYTNMIDAGYQASQVSRPPASFFFFQGTSGGQEWR